MREFIVVYDYGMGGVWALILAPSRSILESAYPELTLIDERPERMDQSEYERIARRSRFPFDEPTDYWRRFYRPSR
jgi:hypothetical protein